jgi:cytochrome b subunit of formate dehydrogenase
MGRQATAARASKEAAHEEHIQRFDIHQRIQHFLMMSTFITLTLTGLPQRFSSLDVSEWWVSTLGGLETVRLIHRTAGVIMLLDCVYHLAYLFTRIGVQGKRTPLQMIPTLQDARDAYDMGRYFLGLAPEKPRFGRFSYLEKFDYWAVFWGIGMIGTTGVILMFAVTATKVLPGDVLPLAHTIHADEAILAVGWIAIVHMFNAHLAPWVFPFNPTIFTGKLSRERYEEDHPLEYERIVARERASAQRARSAVVPALAAVPPVAAALEAAGAPVAAAATASPSPVAPAGKAAASVSTDGAQASPLATTIEELPAASVAPVPRPLDAPPAGVARAANLPRAVAPSPAEPPAPGAATPGKRPGDES